MCYSSKYIRAYRDAYKQIQLPAQYAERMHYELQVIQSMGYSDYFLIVADFMQLCA